MDATTLMLIEKERAQRRIELQKLKKQREQERQRIEDEQMQKKLRLTKILERER